MPSAEGLRERGLLSPEKSWSLGERKASPHHLPGSRRRTEPGPFFEQAVRLTSRERWHRPAHRGAAQGPQQAVLQGPRPLHCLRLPTASSQPSSATGDD